MNELQLKQCDVQGRLFELSADRQLNSAAFVKAFMASHVAKGLDSKFNHMHWAGEEYLLDELTDSVGIENLTKNAEILSKDVLYWMGYIYRFWHFYTGEESTKIYKQASFATMKRNYMMFHTMAPELAVDDLKEIYKQG